MYVSVWSPRRVLNVCLLHTPCSFAVFVFCFFILSPSFFLSSRFENKKRKLQISLMSLWCVCSLYVNQILLKTHLNSASIFHEWFWFLGGFPFLVLLFPSEKLKLALFSFQTFFCFDFCFCFGFACEYRVAVYDQFIVCILTLPPVSRKTLRR